MTALAPLRRPRLWLALWVGLLLLALLACVLPLPAPATAPRHLDKWQHACTHFVLALYAMNLFAAVHARQLALVGLALFGASIEAVQGLLPWRSAELADLVANLAGTALGGMAGWGRFGRLLQRIEQQSG